MESTNVPSISKMAYFLFMPASFFAFFFIISRDVGFRNRKTAGFFP
jgi:hypothetical protein